MQSLQTVLIVDDEPSIRELIKVILADLRLRIKEAESGERALRALRENTIDLILCDFDMPGMSGLELFRAACELNPELAYKFIFVSGADQSVLAELPCQKLPKPFESSALLRAVQTSLEGAPGN